MRKGEIPLGEKTCRICRSGGEGTSQRVLASGTMRAEGKGDEDRGGALVRQAGHWRVASEHERGGEGGEEQIATESSSIGERLGW